LDALAEDRAFLCKGEVFSEAMLDHWTAVKRAKDVREVEARPHPYEFQLYLDA
jgi:glutamine synthetase